MTRWIHGIRPELLRAAFCEYFGLSEEHAEILVVLYGRPGEWVKTKKLQVLLNSHRPPKRQAVYERVRVIREIMEPESLISGGQLEDLGYTLTEVGFAECAKALRVMAETLVRSDPQMSVPGIWEEAIEAEPRPLALPPPQEDAA